MTDEDRQDLASAAAFLRGGFVAGLASFICGYATGAYVMGKHWSFGVALSSIIFILMSITYMRHRDDRPCTCGECDLLFVPDDWA